MFFKNNLLHFARSVEYCTGFDFQVPCRQLARENPGRFNAQRFGNHQISLNGTGDVGVDTMNIAGNFGLLPDDYLARTFDDAFDFAVDTQIFFGFNIALNKSAGGKRVVRYAGVYFFFFHDRM